MTAPQKAYLLPIRFPSSNPTVRVKTGGVTETLTLAVNANEDYWWANDSDTVTGRRDLASKIQLMLATATSGFGYSISYFLGTGMPQYNHSSLTFQFLLSDVLTTVDPALLGFGAVTTAATSSLNATQQPKGIWLPEQEMLFDSYDIPQMVGTVVPTQGGLSRASQLTDVLYHRDIRYHLLPSAKVLTRDVDAAHPYGAFENAWVSQGFGGGKTFRVYDDTFTRTIHSYSTYRFRNFGMPWRRMASETIRLYELAMPLIRVAGPNP